MRPASLPANSANAIASFPSQDIQPARQRHVSDTVDHLPGNLRGEGLASYMERHLPQSNELYLAARTLTTDAMQTDLLMHSRKLRSYIGISDRLRNQFLPSSSTTPPHFAFEALVWAAPRLSSPYQERAITDIDAALQAAATPIQRIALLTELGKHFDKFDPASRQRIASQLLTESRIRAVPDDVLDPFRLCLAEARCIAREQVPGLASPSNRQQHQVNRPHELPSFISGAVDARNAAGLTQAERVIRKNSPHMPAILARLKVAGADLELPDGEGNTLLHRTVMQQNLAGVSALLDNGVAVNAFNTNTTRAISNYAATPETAAATMNHPHWSWSHADQATPLHLAVAFAADPELMRTLIRRGANVNARPGNGITALHWAAAFSDSPMVINTLIECGAAINAESHRQETPLQLASMSQYPLVSMALIAAGANLEARNENQMTALHYAAATSSEPAMLRTLIELGSDLEARAEAQMTPLHLAAASSNEPAMLRTLIALGSDLNSIDDNGRTPLDCAREREEPDIFVNLLLQAGAASGAVLRAAQATQVALAIDLDADFAFALQLHENDLAQIQRNNYAGTSREVADDIDNAQQTSTTQAGPNTSSSGVPVASTTARLSPSESSPTSNVNARRQQLASQLPLFLSDSLVRRVEIWYGSENQTQVPERASDWYATRNDEHATEFGEFLAALSETAEFRQPALQPALQQRMQRLLDAMQTYPELRTQCFALAHDSTSSCGDRVTLALNTMEMARINHHAELGMYTTNDLIELRTGMFRLDVLAQVAREKIAALQAASGGRDVEEIEVVLGFQTLLASHFKLPAVAQAMRYRYSSGITDADLENAKEKVTTREGRDEYIQFIATWKPWQQNLERTRPEVFDALRHHVETEREPLAVQPAFTSEHDYMAMCSELERMQTARQVIALNRLTRQLVVQYRDQQSA